MESATVTRSNAINAELGKCMSLTMVVILVAALWLSIWVVLHVLADCWSWFRAVPERRPRRQAALERLQRAVHERPPVAAVGGVWDEPVAAIQDDALQLTGIVVINPVMIIFVVFHVFIYWWRLRCRRQAALERRQHILGCVFACLHLQRAGHEGPPVAAVGGFLHVPRAAIQGQPLQPQPAGQEHQRLRNELVCCTLL